MNTMHLPSETLSRTSLPKMDPTCDFHYRHTRMQELGPGAYRVEEHFWINRQSPEQVLPQNLYCRAYGECHWKLGTSIEFAKSNTGWTFEYITGGSAVIYHDGLTKTLKAGHLLIHAPGRGCRVQVDQETGLSKRTIILFGSTADYFCNRAKVGISPVLELEDDQKVNRIYENIKSVVVSSSSFLPSDLAIYSYALILELGRVVELLRYPGELGHAINFIECKLHSSITLSSLSAECHISASALNRLFREFLNVSPINYIISRRLERARHLISIKDLSLKEISSQCGYIRESFFSRAFKQRFGVSPNSYRKFLVSNTSLSWPPIIQ